MDQAYVLLIFGLQEGTAKSAYRKDLEEEPGIERERELSGGGLVRSHGGWSKVQFKRKRGERALCDERIPGGDGFVRAALKDAEERKEVLLPAEDRLYLFDEDIKRASKSGKLSGLKKEVARTAVFEYGLSLAETARPPVVTIDAGSCMLKTQSGILGNLQEQNNVLRISRDF